MSARSHARAGDVAWGRMTKVNGELFALTYGAMVKRLLEDHSEIDEVNEHLEKMGYNIGIRLVDEFLAKSGLPPCSGFVETAEVVAKVAFRMFLGVTADVTGWNPEGTVFSLLLADNPLAEFVELPRQYRTLSYSNILCGVLRGALEMIQYRVEVQFVRDVLRGDDVNELRVELKEIMNEEMSEEYKED
mmetsp:Transcript_9386/g.35144  ORF Transcript_9386/g.35144 Transcript_9386/m.35144 type:complete len:189 (-) Transcript_9386:30-596(-)